LKSIFIQASVTQVSDVAHGPLVFSVVFGFFFLCCALRDPCNWIGPSTLWLWTLMMQYSLIVVCCIVDGVFFSFKRYKLEKQNYIKDRMWLNFNECDTHSWYIEDCTLRDCLEY
jgi:protein-tyrosine phosphatase